VASTTHARIAVPAAAAVDPSQIMMSAKDLPTAELVDHTFVFR